MLHHAVGAVGRAATFSASGPLSEVLTDGSPLTLFAITSLPAMFTDARPATFLAIIFALIMNAKNYTTTLPAARPLSVMDADVSALSAASVKEICDGNPF